MVLEHHTGQNLTTVPAVKMRKFLVPSLAPDTATFTVKYTELLQLLCFIQNCSLILGLFIVDLYLQHSRY